ncbi:MAG TPA: S9 family peptidase [Usitatibacter sp.]|nr:S9 family peptidase [Usitatibacter sp.]
MVKPFTPEDLALFQDLGQLDVSSRGVAACVVRSVDMAQDGYVSTIWTFPLDAAPARRFTLGTSGENCPRWSPDGRTLAFVSPRDGLPQVHLIAADGGEARQLSHLRFGVGSIQWSPDGTKLLATCALPLDPDSGEAAALADEPRSPDAPEVAWRVPYKSDGTGYLLARAFHLCSIDAATGEDTPVTRGAFDVMASCWSPDSTRIAYVRTREGREAHRTDLWIANADGSEARQVTRDYASVMSPRWSPDGRWIAFAAGREEGDAQTRLHLFEVASGDARQLGDDDMEVGSPDSLQWKRDSRAVILVVATRARQHIVAVSVDDGRRRDLVTGDRHIAEVRATGGTLAYFSESATTPRELYASNLDGTGERKLSSLNAWWDDRLALVSEVRTFRVPDGRGGFENIDAWLVRAKGSEAPQPLLVEAHGGPNSFALLGFPWNTYWNALCSKGWAVVVPHAVGSTGFGRKFAERLNGHWGELDFPQFMAVVDALQADGIATDHVAIAGKSYGGYLAAWAVGHTDRFKAAIVAAPVANLESHFGTSDGGYYSQPYVLSAERHIEPERYRKLSPVNHIHHCTTPTLLLQGKDDQRCPMGQSEELFAVLMRCGKAPAELVLYPGGDHHVYETGKPSHRLDIVRRMLGWLERWCPPPDRGQTT